MHNVPRCHSTKMYAVAVWTNEMGRQTNYAFRINNYVFSFHCLRFFYISSLSSVTRSTKQLIVYVVWVHFFRLLLCIQTTATDGISLNGERCIVLFFVCCDEQTMCITNIRLLSVTQITCTNTFALPFDKWFVHFNHFSYLFWCLLLFRLDNAFGSNAFRERPKLRALLGFHDALQWFLCALCTCDLCLLTISFDDEEYLIKVSEHVNGMPAFKIKNCNGYAAFAERLFQFVCQKCGKQEWCRSLELDYSDNLWKWVGSSCNILTCVEHICSIYWFWFELDQWPIDDRKWDWKQHVSHLERTACYIIIDSAGSEFNHMWLQVKLIFAEIRWARRHFQCYYFDLIDRLRWYSDICRSIASGL